jgi:hypothetical protein
VDGWGLFVALMQYAQLSMVTLGDTAGGVVAYKPGRY